MALINLIFYPKTIVRNRKYFWRKGATIAVSNHPNTLFDPLAVAVRLNRVVHFLVNAGLYKSRAMAWFLNETYGIKVERKQDVGDKKLSNEFAFQQAAKFLSGGGCLYSAVEGGSDIPRRLRKVKTGTARIALTTEAMNNFQLGLEILPVGLNYSSQTEFRSHLFINAAEPIRVAEFKESFEKDNFQAALELTAEIEKRLENVLIDTVDNEEDAFLRKLEAVAETEQKLPLVATWERSKKLLRAWQDLKNQNPKEASEFQDKVEEYFDFLEKNKTRDRVFRKIQKSGFQLNWWIRTIFLIIGFPVFLYGWLNNFLANYIPAWANKKMNLHIAYTSTIKILVGIFTYLIFYGIQIWLVKYFFQDIRITWGYIVSLLLAGVFAWRYHDFAKDTLSGWRLSGALKKGKNTAREYFEDRNSIVKKINDAL